VKDKNPSFIFLMETISSKFYMEKVRCRLGYDCLFAVDPVGRSGGLALLWKNFDRLEIYNYSRFHIQAIVKDNEGNAYWKLTGFYGHPEHDKRKESWALLKHLKATPSLPWCCAGDFNEILEQAEKDGAGPRRESQMVGFREAMEEWELSDLGFNGPRFTWSNRHTDNSFTQERLDRALGSHDWCLLFPGAVVSILEAICSDHNPILVSFKEKREDYRFCRGGFKFEAAWSRDAEYQGLIQSAWEQDRQEGDSILGIMHRLFSCQRELLRWSKIKFGKVDEMLKKKKKQLLELQNRSNSGSLKEIKSIQAEINEILEREDMRWKQWAKQHWYLAGDKNTQFFHSWANQRRKLNSIHSVTDVEGRVWRRKKEVSKIFVDFYSHLFSSQCPVGIEECLCYLECRVSDDMNQNLLRPFTGEEVKSALFQMHPLNPRVRMAFQLGFSKIPEGW
jgi:hypothetical protein